MIAHSRGSGSKIPGNESTVGPGIARRLVRGFATGVLAVLGAALIFDAWNYFFSSLVAVADVGVVRIEYPFSLFIGRWEYPLSGFYWSLSVALYSISTLLLPLSIWAIKIATPGPLNGWPLGILVGVAGAYVVSVTTNWSLYILVFPNFDLFSVIGILLIAVFSSVAFWAFHRSSVQLFSGRRRGIPLITLVTSILLFPIYLFVFWGRQSGSAGIDMAPTLLVLLVALWFVTAGLYVISCSLWLKALVQSDLRRHVLSVVLLGVTLVVFAVELWIGRLRPFIE